MKYGAEGIKFHNTNLFGFLIVVVAINVITPWPLLSAGIAATLCLTFCMLVARGYEATYRHRQARTALGRYLPISVVEEVTSRPTDLRVNGVRREIVALFSDLEGFTSLSEDIDAQTLSALINDYLDILAALVDRFSGTLDKFIGDGMVAFWSAPSVSTAEAQAVLAALAISKAGGDFAARIASDGIALGRTRVGVCGGPAIVGHFGGSTRLQYTALGNAMNTASRLESANKALHTGVLVSDDVMRASGLACFRPMGRIRLAGLASPLIAWEASDLDPALNLDLTRLWTDFDAGDFGALDTLDRLSRERPSDRALVAVVARLRQEGPGGTFTLPVK